MPKKILVVEDDASVLEILKMALEQKGYDVSTAANGRLGLEAAAQFQPDVLVTDVMMPELNGYQLVYQLSVERHDIPLPKIIILTSRTDPPDVQMGLNVGADIYITKPFQVQEILDGVQELLEPSSAPKTEIEGHRA
jgi:DNA-binding response OmpR family regulator